MNLRTLKPRPADGHDQAARGARGALRVVDNAPRIIEWPRRPATVTPDSGTAVADADQVGVLIKAEVLTKRFHDHSVDAARYSATLRATDGSPYALMAALVEACGVVEELRVAGAQGDQLILQVILRS